MESIMKPPTKLAGEFLAQWGISLGDLAGYVGTVSDSETLLLVGSITEGLANPLSDIDLLIVGDGGFDAGLVINETEFREWASNLPYGPELNIEYWRTEDLEKIGQRLNDSFALMQDPSQIHGPSKLKKLERFSETELRLLHRLRTGVALANIEAAESWRRRLLLNQLPQYLIVHSLSYHNIFREDTIAQSRYGDHLSALYMLRFTMDYLASAMLASVGETNPYPKWRIRLLDRYKGPLGESRVRALSNYLFPHPGRETDAAVRETLGFADASIGEILIRCPQIVPVWLEMGNLFPFVKQVDEVFRQERPVVQ
jgi:Nucleotidyltransferase domain